jgi:zinc transport system ATP-binding protein
METWKGSSEVWDTMNRILEIDKVCISYGSQSVVSDVSLNVDRGEFIGLIGPNGSGKTTLVKAALKLVPFQSGTIRWNGNGENRDVRIGYLPQRISAKDKYFPATAREIIETGMSKSFKKLDAAQRRSMFDDVVEMLGISNLLEKKIGLLSGGQHQLVLMARALYSCPDILILDEPTSALDPDARHSLLEIMEKVQSKGVAVIMITHDIEAIGLMTKRLVYLDRTIQFDGDFNGYEEFQRRMRR